MCGVVQSSLAAEKDERNAERRGRIRAEVALLAVLGIWIGAAISTLALMN